MGTESPATDVVPPAQLRRITPAPDEKAVLMSASSSSVETASKISTMNVMTETLHQRTDARTALSMTAILAMRVELYVPGANTAETALEMEMKNVTTGTETMLILVLMIVRYAIVGTALTIVVFGVLVN